MTENDKIIRTEVEVECKKCKHIEKIEVPLKCDAGEETLECEIIGELSDYIPVCKKCGSTELKIKKEKGYG
jgi:primosomal protein N'